MAEEGSFGSKASYNCGCNKPTHAASDSPAMAKQAAPNDPPCFGGLGVMSGGLPMVDERILMARVCLDELPRQLKLAPSFKMKRERQAKHAQV